MGPLNGVKVIEFAGLGPGPMAGMLLADLGADVVRIERPGHVPDARDVVQRGKRGVTLDLKSPDDRARALALIARADLLIEGFRPGVTERLGLGPADCMAVNPRIVYGRVTGWGQTGPLAQQAGHDINYIALSGALHAIGRRGQPPTPPMNFLGDYAGGALYLVIGLISALWQARGSGKGQVIDAAILDGTLSLMAKFCTYHAMGQLTPERGSNTLDSGAPFYDVYQCADGGWIAVGAIEPQFYALLLAGLGFKAQDLPDQWDKAAWPTMKAHFAACFATRSRDAWAEAFAETDACVTPVLSLLEASEHPHNRHRSNLLAPGGILQPAPAPRFSGASLRPPSGLAPVTATPERVVAGWSAVPEPFIEQGA